MKALIFYFMGDLRTIDYRFVEQTMDSEKGEFPILKMSFKIDKQVDSNIYKYITSLLKLKYAINYKDL